MRSKEHLEQHYYLSTTTLWVYSLIAEFLYLVLLVIQARPLPLPHVRR